MIEYDLNKVIEVNGRKLPLSSILDVKSKPEDQEETYLFEFCRQWFGGNKVFTQQTSGSTGTPTTITLSKEKMILSAEMTNTHLGITSSDVNLVCLSVNYIAGKMMLVRAFINNQSFTFKSPSSNPLEKLDSAVDFVALVPYQIQKCIENAKTLELLNRIRHILVGGASIDYYLENLIKEKVTSKVYHTFGMTETCSHIALRAIQSPDAAYQTLASTQIGTDERGCLTLASPLTNNETIVTNDLVELTSSNSFTWIGRIDNIINSGGIKLQIETLEKEYSSILRFQKAENRIIVFSKPNKEFGEIVCLIIEGTPQEVKFPDSLPSIRKPKEIHFVSKFSETPTQKIDRIKTIAALTQS